MKRLALLLVNIIMIISAVIAVAAFIVPIAFRARPVVVLSGSMEPVLNVGGVALMEQVNPTNVNIGDIITFKAPADPGVMITHRVIEIVSQSPLIFQTQGDAVGNPDAFVVPATNIVGKVRFHVPRVGFYMHYLARGLRTPLGFGLTIGLTSAILIGGEIRNILSLIQPGNRRAKLIKRRSQRLSKRWPRAARRLA